MAALMMVSSCFTAISPIFGATYLQARNKSTRYPTDNILFQCSLREHHIGLRLVKNACDHKSRDCIIIHVWDLNFSIL